MKNIAKLTSYGCYLDCDFVTAKYPGNETHIVGNVAEYVYDLEQKISDLEAKLAESEKRLLEWQEDSIRDNQIYNEQLAEKEKLIEDYSAFFNQLFNQDKISFAVEQLEKVKELVRDNSKATGFIFAEQTIDVEDFEDLIDNQIMQLKEMK